jgi:hypothetical protein
MAPNWIVSLNLEKHHHVVSELNNRVPRNIGLSSPLLPSTLLPFAYFSYYVMSALN